MGDRYFSFGAPKRKEHNGFTGALTRNTYTKAASLLCLKEMLPEDKLTLVDEQEAGIPASARRRAYRPKTMSAPGTSDSFSMSRKR